MAGLRWVRQGETWTAQGPKMGQCRGKGGVGGWVGGWGGGQGM
jgi:hypothetical protein